jgi:hypothetical protein
VAALATASPAAVQAIAGGGAEVAAQLAENLASGAVRAGVVAGLVALLATAAAAARLGRALPVILAAAIAFDLSGGNASAYVLGPAPDSSAPPLAAGLAPGARVLSPFAEREDRWPELDLEVSKREWSRRTLGPAWNVPLRVGTHHDYVGLREARWAELRRSLGDGPRVAHLGLFAFAHLVVPGDPALSARAGAPLPPRIEAADPALPAWRVELPHRPRAYLAGEVRAATPDEALAFAGNGGAGGGTVVEGPVAAGPAAAGGEARLVEEAPCRVVVEAASEGRALLVLNDAFAPGWRAEVDGREAAILRANALVRGVWLEPGRHRVVFDYRTPGLREGWWAALLGAVALAGWALGRRVQRRSRREKMAAASASTTTV